jgi:hypothetical protein
LKISGKLNQDEARHLASQLTTTKEKSGASARAWQKTDWDLESNVV